jgi:hypothetical protein
MLTLLSALVPVVFAGEPSELPALDPVLARAVALRPDACVHQDMMPSSWNTKYRIKAKLHGDEGPTLHGVPCDSGAYNLVYVFFTQSDKGEYRNIGFAEPDTKYVEATDSAPAATHVVGWLAKDALVNPVWDDTAQTLTTFNRARGMGDAGSRGVWGFEGGRTVLRYYERDFTYDGQYTPTVFFVVEGMAQLPPPPQQD